MNPPPGTALWHGGISGLRPGDYLTGGHDRHHDCDVCRARAEGTPTIDPPTGHPDQVYVTSDRLYARFYASMAIRGDLYRVEPEGEIVPSTEDRFPTWRVTTARVVSVFERAVVLTSSERRRLNRRWIIADATAEGRLDQLEAMSPRDRRNFEEAEYARMVKAARRIAASRSTLR